MFDRFNSESGEYFNIALLHQQLSTRLHLLGIYVLGISIASKFLKVGGVNTTIKLQKERNNQIRAIKETKK